MRLLCVILVVGGDTVVAVVDEVVVAVAVFVVVGDLWSCKILNGFLVDNDYNILALIHEKKKPPASLKPK